MKSIVFHPEAQTEFFAAQDYYERCVDGLGADFCDEVLAATEIIQVAPHRWSSRAHGTRCYLVHRFPFAIIYLDLPTKIWVVAVAHLHRRPGYWKDRL